MLVFFYYFFVFFSSRRRFFKLLVFGFYVCVLSLPNTTILKDKFYLSLDIKQSIIPKYTLLEELKYHKKSNLINKEVRPIGNQNIGIIKKILYPNVNYFKQKGKKIQIQQEPIVGIIFKKNNNNIIYSYLASHLKFYYSPKDINNSKC